MEILKTIWKFIDGNKTIIGTFLLLLMTNFGHEWFSSNVYELINWIIVTLTGASFVHHVKKGKFTIDKN